LRDASGFGRPAKRLIAHVADRHVRVCDFLNKTLSFFPLVKASFKPDTERPSAVASETSGIRCRQRPETRAGGEKTEHEFRPGRIDDLQKRSGFAPKEWNEIQRR